MGPMICCQIPWCQIVRCWVGRSWRFYLDAVSNKVKCKPLALALSECNNAMSKDVRCSYRKQNGSYHANEEEVDSKELIK